MIAIICIVLAILSFICYAFVRNNTRRRLRTEKYNYLNLRKTVAHEALQKLQSLKSSVDLMALLNLHRSLCHPLELNSNKNLGPCSWGMFRTKDISKMDPSEVMLGDIYGIWTQPLSFWLTCKDTMAGNGWGIDEDIPIKKIIFDQYWNHLRSNLRAIEVKATQDLSIL